MEPNQETPAINQETTSPTPSVINSVEKPKKSHKGLLILFGLFIFLILAGGIGGGYYLGKNSQNESINNNSQTPTNSLDNQTNNAPTQASNKATNKLTLADALTKFCVKEKITLDKLPFTLDQEIKNKYKIDSQINCYVPEENYAQMNIQVEGYGYTRSIDFFHQNSVFMGMYNMFEPLSTYEQISVNGQNYWLHVLEPGPFGISSLGVNVDLISEKKGESSGTIARVIYSESLKDPIFINLVKKYGEKTSSSEPGYPEYILKSDYKKVFIKELINLANQNNTIKNSAQEITSDLNNISF